MDVITLPAHFDGERIRLDEPYELAPDTKLLVMILPERPTDDEQEALLSLSMRGLESAYGEGEPDYAAELVREANPEYEAR